MQLIKQYIKRRLFETVRNAEIEQNALIIKQVKRLGNNANFGLGSRLSGVEFMEIGDNFCCGKHAWIEAISNYNNYRYNPRLVIGDNFQMAQFGHIGCVNSIEIGDNVLVGSKVLITDHFHGSISSEDLALPPCDRPLSYKPVIIRNNVWIGDNVCIMPGVTLGDNVIVGANAVVTHSFEPNAVIAGCPARLIKFL